MDEFKECHCKVITKADVPLLHGRKILPENQHVDRRLKCMIDACRMLCMPFKDSSYAFYENQLKTMHRHVKDTMMPTALHKCMTSWANDKRIALFLSIRERYIRPEVMQ